MSLSSILFLGSMSLVFIGQRLLAGDDALQAVVTLAGGGVFLGAAGLRWRAMQRAQDEGLKLGHRVALICLLVVAGALVVYTGTTDVVVQRLSLGEEAEARWLGVWRSMWPLIWLLGAVPMLSVDYACQSSPVVMPRRRVRELALHGLVAAMGVGLVFPVNYIASRKKERWDLAYFKTPQPGTATLALAQALEAPVDVRIFMPPSSEVAQELLAFFAPLQSPMLRVQVIDQAAEPRLAKELSVRDNGTVAFTLGELSPSLGEPDEPDNAAAPKPITRRLTINPDFERAKRALKKLDADVSRMLIELGQGERVAYVTVGHGELSWKHAGALDGQIKGLRAALKDLGFSVKELGLRQGLAEAVPEDADVVLVLGPRHPLQPLEVQSLRTYLEAGGSLFLGFEPRASLPGPVPAASDPLVDLAAEVLGVQVEEGVLADARNHVPLFNNQRDNYLLATDAFSSHPSSRALAQERAPVVLPVAGHLTPLEGHDASVSVTVRTMATAWVDLDANAQFDPDGGEVKRARNVVAAVTGGATGVSWRALVSADASIVSDVGLGNEKVPAGALPGVGFRGNIQFTQDAMNWLIGAEGLSGITQNEEDVRIEHTKDDQIWWFYSTVLGVPLLVFGAGTARVGLRRRTAAARGGRS